ncbi:MAG: type II toxin-antitoxin system YoeB family toxin [Pseudomonadota bacterium]
MNYEIKVLHAEDDLEWFRNKSKKDYLKCFDLVRATAIAPRNGIGKPERLKYFDKEVYSRRVNHEDRMIYTISEDEDLTIRDSVVSGMELRGLNLASEGNHKGLPLRVARNSVDGFGKSA